MHAQTHACARKCAHNLARTQLFPSAFPPARPCASMPAFAHSCTNLHKKEYKQTRQAGYPRCQ
eukprot:3556704-Pleurochrysis_carterae.AAC.1